MLHRMTSNFFNDYTKLRFIIIILITIMISKRDENRYLNILIEFTNEYFFIDGKIFIINFFIVCQNDRHNSLK